VLEWHHIIFITIKIFWHAGDSPFFCNLPTSTCMNSLLVVWLVYRELSWQNSLNFFGNLNSITINTKLAVDLKFFSKKIFLWRSECWFVMTLPTQEIRQSKDKKLLCFVVETFFFFIVDFWQHGKNHFSFYVKLTEKLYFPE
jgi:hypothetical protein